MSDERKKTRLREEDRPDDRLALDRAFGVVEEFVNGNETVRTAVKDILWFLQESEHRALLASTRLHIPPEIARQQDVHDRAFAAGIEYACHHITDGKTMREVREWLASEATQTEEP